MFRFLNAVIAAQDSVSSMAELVQSEQANIDSIVAEAFSKGTPYEALAAVDGAKSLLTQALLFKKRSPDADLVVFGTSRENVGQIFEVFPDIVVVNLYQSPDNDFRVLMAFTERRELKIEIIDIATGSAGRDLHKRILTYASFEAGLQPEGARIDITELLGPFGSQLLPRLKRLGTSRRALLIPHRSTHILPLHIMMADVKGESLFMDSVTPISSYAPSIFGYTWGAVKLSGIVQNDSDKVARDMKLLLACVDVEALGELANAEAESYGEVLRTTSAEYQLVKTADDFPDDPGAFRILSWCTHGYSNPNDWTRSSLQFGDRTFTAIEIIERWNLGDSFAALLSACQTGLDLRSDTMVDEYCGLDMAFYISGVPRVVSTMWRVQQIVATLTNMLMFEFILMGKSPSEVLPHIRYLLISGHWRDAMEDTYRDLSSRPLHDGVRARKHIIECLLEYPRDAFVNFRSWGVYRNFGRL